MSRAPERLQRGDGTLVVVPTFNEALNVARLVSSVLDVVPAAHLLVIDDASPDGTGQLLAALSRTEGRLQVLQRGRKLGIGSAYVAGFLSGLERGYARFVQMDGDLSHDPADVPRLLEELAAGADVALGSRNVPGGGVAGWGLMRHALSRGGSLYARLALRSPVRDMTSGFKAFTRQALLAVDIGNVRSSGYAFQIETTFRALRAELRVREVPITFTDRRAGQSKMTRAEVLEAVTAVWRLR